MLVLPQIAVGKSGDNEVGGHFSFPGTHAVRPSLLSERIWKGLSGAARAHSLAGGHGSRVNYGLRARERGAPWSAGRGQAILRRWTCSARSVARPCAR